MDFTLSYRDFFFFFCVCDLLIILRLYCTHVHAREKKADHISHPYQCWWPLFRCSSSRWQGDLRYVCAILQTASVGGAVFSTTDDIRGISGQLRQIVWRHKGQAVWTGQRYTLGPASVLSKWVMCSYSVLSLKTKILSSACGFVFESWYLCIVSSYLCVFHMLKKIISVPTHMLASKRQRHEHIFHKCFLEGRDATGPTDSLFQSKL